MEINKAAQAASSGAPTAVQLEAINNLAKAHLTAQQVYVFSLRLCDDQVDRDFERFDSAALPGLAKLFIGKTGIVDHKWSSDKQVARIFQTEVVREDGAEFIKALAYIRRGDANDEIIADIEAGIKKEVSVGCACMMARISSLLISLAESCSRAASAALSSSTPYRFASLTAIFFTLMVCS